MRLIRTRVSDGTAAKSSRVTLILGIFALRAFFAEGPEKA